MQVQRAAPTLESHPGPQKAVARTKPLAPAVPECSICMQPYKDVRGLKHACLTPSDELNRVRPCVLQSLHRVSAVCARVHHAQEGYPGHRLLSELQKEIEVFRSSPALLVAATRPASTVIYEPSPHHCGSVACGAAAHLGSVFRFQTASMRSSQAYCKNRKRDCIRLAAQHSLWPGYGCQPGPGCVLCHLSWQYKYSISRILYQTNFLIYYKC